MYRMRMAKKISEVRSGNVVRRELADELVTALAFRQHASTQGIEFVPIDDQRWWTGDFHQAESAAADRAIGFAGVAGNFAIQIGLSHGKSALKKSVAAAPARSATWD